MPYADLREFLKTLEREGELARIKEPVSPILEISEVTDRVSKTPGGGKALLFEKVEGYSVPVLTNMLGSEKRIKLALGYENLEDIGWKLYRLLRPEIPNTFLEKLKRLPELKKLNDSLPRIVRKGPVKENIIREKINVLDFPIPKCWPEDGGRYITFGQVITKDPESGVRNVGLYRVQVLSERELALHWQIHKDGNHHYWKAKRLGKKLEVAIAIGGDPVLSYVASAPLPPEVDEYLFAGLIREEGVELVKGETVELEYPAHAEIVIEGYVDPQEELVDEGPFGDHTGFYTPVDKYPKMHITAILHRDNPIYLSTLVGRPPQEDKYIGWATERIFLPLIKFNLPEVVDYHLPAEGCFHNFCFVSIKKRYPGHAFKVAYALLGLGLMSLEKVIVVFDEWVNVHSMEEVLWAWGNNMDPSRDVLILKGPIDVLDHSTSQVGFGGKMVIDATTKWKEEGYTREWPKVIEMSKEAKEKIDKLWDRIKYQIYGDNRGA
ncbi:MAG: menaquinone biosynthesis decarboxylase [Hydrogenobacter thermophilus]|uniref:menaquinone biosynthesis decarboxylase n=1 Tax=Hydrogenobacter thermophilus TaxID=940 RepID=UPI001C766FDD|nr:menaquinone biosynthesis decarboxylase [Hydrogenobacter thermophilus]QWK19572.1 MAG: menaquinone biosynthesis decarboxylase [Hydrogenobacter thermophilus]